MQTNINYCMINNCRFKTTHTTRSHICGFCNKTGHGQIECNNFSLQQKLIEHYNDIIEPNERCKFNDCELKLFHKPISHQCEYCKKFGHPSYECPNINFKIICPVCRCDNNIKLNQKNISGLNIECCICMDKQVEIYFPDCGHACICSICYTKARKL